MKEPLGLDEARPSTSEPTKESSSESNYSIEEREPVNIPVPINSPLSIAAHFTTWICWAVYLTKRWPGAFQSSNLWLWAIYMCEIAISLHDMQTAMELTLFLFGPRDFVRRVQFSLNGTRAPKVHVFITVCGENVDMIMDSVAAAAYQEYPAARFQVFVLDDAKDEMLLKAVERFNLEGTDRAGFEDVVYFAREKTPHQRHYYKSGNIRSGLEMTKERYGSSEYFASLDADMVSERDWLARTVPHLIKDPRAALVSPPQGFYNILNEDGLSQDSNAYSQILEPVRDVFGCSQCSGSGYVMRRSALDTIGGWPLANIGEDILCSYMLQAKGWETRYIPDQVQFGLAPESMQSYINQRIRWTNGSLLVAQYFRFFLPYTGRCGKLNGVQHGLGMMQVIKSYIMPFTFLAAVSFPICLLALQPGIHDSAVSRNAARTAFALYFLAFTISKKLVYGRLGSRNVAVATASRFWTSPLNTFCLLRSLVYDPAETSFQVSGTLLSSVNERSAAHRKPLLQRLTSLTMLLYTAYFLFVTAVLAAVVLSVAQGSLSGKSYGTYLYTCATLKLLDIVLAAYLPVGYMVFPPTVPQRRELLEKDEQGVLRSRKKSWTKREGGSRIKLPLQVALILLFDWL